jgi:hypothetical protein
MADYSQGYRLSTAIAETSTSMDVESHRAYVHGEGGMLTASMCGIKRQHPWISTFNARACAFKADGQPCQRAT